MQYDHWFHAQDTNVYSIGFVLVSFWIACIQNWGLLLRSFKEMYRSSFDFSLFEHFFLNAHFRMWKFTHCPVQPIQSRLWIHFPSNQKARRNLMFFASRHTIQRRRISPHLPCTKKQVWRGEFFFFSFFRKKIHELNYKFKAPKWPRHLWVILCNSGYLSNINEIELWL